MVIFGLQNSIINNRPLKIIRIHRGYKAVHVARVQLQLTVIKFINGNKLKSIVIQEVRSISITCCIPICIGLEEIRQEIVLSGNSQEIVNYLIQNQLLHVQDLHGLLRRFIILETKQFIIQKNIKLSGGHKEICQMLEGYGFSK